MAENFLKIRNGVSLGNLPSAPSLPVNGDMYYDGTANKFKFYQNGSWAEFGAGAVTSVGLSLPSIFDVTGSPVTSTGTLTATLASQLQNLIFASPNGSTGAPSFRSLVAADIPNLDASKIASGTIATARLGSGTADATTFLRGDQGWQAISLTVNAVGSSPNANGATVSGLSLTLQPADETNAGAMSVNAQTFNGLKTFNTGISTAYLRGTEAWIGSSNDQAITGSNTALAAQSSLNQRFTSSSLISIGSAPLVTSSTKYLRIWTNVTGNPIKIINEYSGATATDRIQTGTDADILLLNNSSVFSIYDSTASRWKIISGQNPTIIGHNAGENITAGQAVYLSAAGTVFKGIGNDDTKMEFIGFAVNTALTGNLVAIKVSGELTGFSGLTIGEPVFLSVSVAGGVQQTVPTVDGEWVVQVGMASSATNIVINAAASATAIKITSAPETGSSFNLANNQVSASNITGLAFNGAGIRSAEISYSIYRNTSTTELVERGTLLIAYKPVANTWSLVNTFAFDDSGVTLSITNAGQVQYTSTNMSGTGYVGNIKWAVLAEESA